MNIPRVHSLLHESCQLKAEDALVIGVSGGADSLALLVVLLELGYHPVVAHLDHGLRPSSKEEADFVAGFAARIGLECQVEHADVAGFAQDSRLTIEEAARIQRYRFLFSVARQKQARAVLVAHTADDQVETVLMHLLRGSGLAGLQGMQLLSVNHGWDDGIPLARPFLETWKSEILEYCRERDLHPVEDESNLDTSYLRNRIRQELIPHLATYNKEIKPALLRLAANVKMEYPVIQAAVESAWQDCLRSRTRDSVCFSISKIKGYPQAIQAGLIRRGVGCLLTDLSGLDQAAVLRALDFIPNLRSDKIIELTGGITLSVLEEMLILSRNDIQDLLDEPLLPGNLPSGQAFELTIPGEVPLDNGWSLCAEMLNLEATQLTFEGLHAYLDADVLQFPLTVRSRRAGDRFRPFGLTDGTIKLSDFMINQKIPRQARSRWPLVCSGEEVLWVAGSRQAEHTRIKKDTEHVVHLYLHR